MTLIYDFRPIIINYHSSSLFNMRLLKKGDERISEGLIFIVFKVCK